VFRFKWFLPVLAVAVIAAVSLMALLPPKVTVNAQGTVSIDISSNSEQPQAYDFSGDPNCVALWKFDNNALDSKGGNDLTEVNTPTYDAATKREGTHSIDFEEASAQYCYITDADLDAGFPGKNGTSEQSFSICFWVKFETVNDYRGLVAKYNGDTNERSYLITLWNASKLRFRIGYNGGASSSNIDFDTAFSTGKWYHCAVVYNASDNGMKIRIWDDYAGTLLDNNKTGTAAGDMSPDTGDFAVGLLDTDHADLYHTDGKMDEVVIFKDVLSDAEIDEIRAEGQLKGVVGETTDVASIRIPPQRNSFYAAGRHWVFYCEPGTDDLVYKTSTDGVAFGDRVEIGSLPTPNGANFDVHFDGTYVHYARNNAADGGAYKGIKYRRGTPQSNGTITWSAVEQEALADTDMAGDVSVITDSNGYPWIAYASESATPAWGDPTVTTSSTNDGTWATEDGYPLGLYTGDYWFVFLVPQTSGKLCAIIYHSSVSAERIQARFYNGSAWEAIEYATAVGDLLSISEWAMLCATSISDEIHLVYHESGETNLQYLHGHLGSWSAETTIATGVATLSSPVIGKHSDNFYVFWQDDDDHVYYRQFNGSSWEDAVDWVDETTETFPSERLTQCFFESYGDFLGASYQTQASSPYYVKYAFLDLSGGPEITNTQSTWGPGTLEVGTTSNTAINWSTIENTGTGAVDVTIQGTDLAGGDDTWDLADDGSPGENIYGLYAGLDDDDDTFDVIVAESTANTLLEDLAEDATQDWGIKIYMPTSVTGYDGNSMTAVVTLVASAAS